MGSFDLIGICRIECTKHFFAPDTSADIHVTKVSEIQQHTARLRRGNDICWLNHAAVWKLHSMACRQLRKQWALRNAEAFRSLWIQTSGTVKIRKSINKRYGGSCSLPGSVGLGQRVGKEKITATTILTISASSGADSHARGLPRHIFKHSVGPVSFIGPNERGGQLVRV